MPGKFPNPPRNAPADYPLSLQSAARALWGDDFWGRYRPIPLEKHKEAPAQRR